MSNKMTMYIRQRMAHILSFLKGRPLSTAERYMLQAAQNQLYKRDKSYEDLYSILYAISRLVFNKKDVIDALNDPEIELKDIDHDKDFLDLMQDVTDDVGEGTVDEDVLETLLDELEDNLVNLHKRKYTPYNTLMHGVSTNMVDILDILSSSYGDKIDKDKISNEKAEEIEAEKKLIPSKIVSGLDEYVIGQKEVKKQLSVYVANHYNSFINNPDEMYKQSLLILGETGTGKTLLVKSIAKIIDRPVHIVDITEFSKTGYVGKSVNDMLAEIAACKYPEPPIVFIDEFDKLSGYGLTDGKGGTNMMDDSVQNNLLKLVEGDDRIVEKKQGAMSGTEKINTHKMCFIFGGSFQKLIEDKRTKAEGKLTANVGFDKTSPKKRINIQLDHNDISTAGIKRELVGRIGMIVQTEPLSQKVWMDILTKPRGCVKDHFNKLFKDNGLEDKVTDKDLKAIIKKAKGADLGARGLWAIAGVHFSNRLFY